MQSSASPQEHTPPHSGPKRPGGAGHPGAPSAAVSALVSGTSGANPVTVQTFHRRPGAASGVAVGWDGVCYACWRNDVRGGAARGRGGESFRGSIASCDLPSPGRGDSRTSAGSGEGAGGGGGVSTALDGGDAGRGAAAADPAGPRADHTVAVDVPFYAGKGEGADAERARYAGAVLPAGASVRVVARHLRLAHCSCSLQPPAGGQPPCVLLTAGGWSWRSRHCALQHDTLYVLLPGRRRRAVVWMGDVAHVATADMD
eukprot:gene23061-34623_t